MPEETARAPLSSGRSSLAQPSVVAVQVVAWNGAQWLPHLLSSLNRQDYPSLEYYFLDNNSADASPGLLEQWLNGHPGRFMRKEKNTGFAAGHNALLRLHHAPYVLVLNQDVVLQPTYIRTLVAYMREYGEVASASGCLLKMRERDGKLVFGDTVDCLGLRLYPTHRVVEMGSGERLVNVRDVPQPVFGVPATAALYRRSALEAMAPASRGALQYFDELFFAYKEDVALAYRLQLNGFASAVVPSAKAFHHRGLPPEADPAHAFGTFRTIRHRARKDQLLNGLSYRNHLYFLVSTAVLEPFSRPWFATLAYELGKACVALFTEPRTLRAWGAVIRAWPELKQRRRMIRSQPLHLDRIRSWMYGESP